MRTATIGRHTVEFYDAIDELPVVRYHKFQKLLLIDAGVGADISAFDARTERARRFLATGQYDEAAKEFDNLRQCVYLIQQEISPKHLAFAALVTKLDGRECTDLSDDALAGVANELKDAAIIEVDTAVEAVKKKIDEGLMMYFPRLFQDPSVKEYHDLLRKRTLAVLEGIVKGELNPEAAADALTAQVLTYIKPKVYAGAEGFEVQYDRQFETLCLALSENLHVTPKAYTVLEFYNAFDFLADRSRQAEKGRNFKR